MSYHGRDDIAPLILLSVFGERGCVSAPYYSKSSRAAQDSGIQEAVHKDHKGRTKVTKSNLVIFVVLCGSFVCFVNLFSLLGLRVPRAGNSLNPDENTGRLRNALTQPRSPESRKHTAELNSAGARCSRVVLWPQSSGSSRAWPHARPGIGGMPFPRFQSERDSPSNCR